jgi:hypothetical protein
VSLTKYIQQELNKAEREALREAWKGEFDFATSAVPYSSERECVRLIDSFVGTHPEQAESFDANPKRSGGAAADGDPGRPFTDEGTGAVADADGAADAAAYEAGKS